MHSRHGKLAIHILSCVLFVTTSAHAGLLTSTDRSVVTLSETALVFWQDGMQQLIIQPSFRASYNTQSSQIGYVIPVPAAPESYAVLESAIIDDTWQWLERIAHTPEPGSDIAPTSGRDAQLHEQTLIGERYNITALSSARELVGWMEQNSFPRIPDTILHPYRNGWSFIAVTVSPEYAADATECALRPIQIVFPSEHITLPIRLTAQSTPYHAFLFVAAAKPINQHDLSACGFTTLDTAAVTRQDHIISQAHVSDTSRAILWYNLAGKLYDASRIQPTADGRNRDIEELGLHLNQRVSSWGEAPLNRLTSFSVQTGSHDELTYTLETARRDNVGDAPPPVTTAYQKFAQETGTHSQDSLYVSALVAPWLNMPNTETDLTQWTRDPAIRLRDLLTPLPRLTSPWPASLALADSLSQPLAPELLPMPDRLHDVFAALLNAVSREELRLRAAEALAQDNAAPNVRFHRQLIATRRIASMRGINANELMSPTDSLSTGHPHSIESIERAFRTVRVPLQAVWMASQYSPERPNPLNVATRLLIAPSGDVTLVDVRGNLPSGVPTSLLRFIIENHVKVAPADSEITLDFVFSIED